MIRFSAFPYTLHFIRPAGTSRGIYTERKVWYVVAQDGDSGAIGIGEAAPLPGLSIDDRADFAQAIEALLSSLTAPLCKEDFFRFESFPSLLFAVETACRHLDRQSWALYDTPFAQGGEGIPINGLIWMGPYEVMYRRIKEKLEQGFRCIKIKIGAIDFDEELRLLQLVRRDFSPSEVELRVDANGAFRMEEATKKLKQLASYRLHSIEQPIAAGNWQAMAELCRLEILPIALDEELIPLAAQRNKEELLATIRPQYIILKPSLHGALYGTNQWIEMAQKYQIGYWITSALESNIGLNALAHYTASLQPSIPQGLGTGLLFHNNLPTALQIDGDRLFYCPEMTISPEAVCTLFVT